jgi:RHS repeat-associated protein
VTTNGSGGTLTTTNYYPFGAEATSATAETKKYTGHERDYNPDGAQDYMHARYYKGNWGRFLSVDPVLNIEKALKEPQRWNRYAYVENNPINKFDPDGRESAQIRINTEVNAYVNHGIQPSWYDPTLQKVALVTMMALSPVDEGVLIGSALGWVGRGAMRLLGKADDVVDGARSASRYDDVTRGGSIENRATNVSRADFGKNLESQGFGKSVSKDGKVTIYQKDGVKYTIRDTSKSGGPTAEVFKDGKLIRKIRLEDELRR